MKKILTAAGCFMAVATLLTISCKPAGEKPENVATDFLTAYLAADFNKAAGFCTNQLSGELKEAVKEIENLDEPLKKQIQASTATFAPQIDKIEKLGKGDTLIINYSVVSKDIDSTSNIVADVIKSSLMIVRVDAAGWKVLKLNK
ncbi:MAG: hypothetical protein RR555_00710 [Bacteroidales bacterium]